MKTTNYTRFEDLEDKYFGNKVHLKGMSMSLI
jgi:hypothetical protein